ncbi:hypothetical protein [Bythopirellula polymerisocia]|uniref:Flagellar M-ring protein n=1 Tax=Bythopirellula polymerisocia TaxID=2528003 RepID=A0A5C6CTR9_9BACT|nr:hypothetical protein [Bythopirellula polymerisocia]TWU27798.1 Flagellar M-ring protein [Bythopirellula polymerisocia]
MDFLNQAIGQVRDLFLSMTPAARVTAALLVGVIGVSLGFLVQQHSAGPDEYLFNGEFLPSEDANRIEVAIAKAGLEGSQREGNRIKVPRGQKAAYLAAVAEAGALPANFHAILDSALDLGPFVDDKTRKEKLKASREQQLSMIIRDMSGIEDAKVIYDIAQPRGMARESVATATVSVQPSPGEALSGQRMKMIRNAVAGAIANLKPENVVVVNLGDGSLFSEDVSPESFDSPYFQHRVAFERHIKGNIEGLLSYIPGVRVQVTAELNPALTRETHTVATEGEATALRESNEERISETQHLKDGGRVGLEANGPGRGRESFAESTVKNSDSNTSSEQNYFVPTKNEITTEAGLVPEHVRVAIAVPMNYLVQVYRERQRRNGEDPNQPLPADISTTLTREEGDLENKIKEVVVPLLTKEIAVDNYKDEIIKVSFFETLTPDPIEPIPASSKALAWASQNFNTLTMAGVALVGLVMLRSLVKGVPPVEPLDSAAAPLLSLKMPTLRENDSAAAGEASDDEDFERPRLKLKKGKNLRDELTDIVREDPDSAAAILRSWIANAG